MTRGRTLAALALTAALVVACRPTGGGASPQVVDLTGWIVTSVGYHGPRGAGTHYVVCAPERGAEQWVEVTVTERVAEGLDSGDPCPARWWSGETDAWPGYWGDQ